MKCNYHTHNTFCDGKEPIEAFVKRASELHFDHLGFSSHAPVDFENSFAIAESDLPAYLEEIKRQQSLHPELQLFAALECDFVPDVTHPFDYFRAHHHFDYLIGGVHLVKPPHGSDLWFIDGSKQEIYDEGLARLFDNNIRKAVTAFWEQTFEMIETQHFDIIAHMDKIKMHNRDRFFHEDEPWYRVLVDHAVSLIKKHNLIVEINLRGLYKKRCNTFYPSPIIIQQLAKADIPVVINSDAHKSEELELFYDEAVKAIRDAGIQQMACLKNGQWTSYSDF